MHNHRPGPQPAHHPFAEPEQIGITDDGRAIYRYPQPTAVQIHHHHAAPQRRGPQPGEVFGWLGIAGAVTALLLAVAVSAVAIAIASVCVAIAVLVLRAVWRDLLRGVHR